MTEGFKGFCQIAASAAFLALSAAPAIAQDVDPAFMAEFQRNCMDEIDAYVGAYPPGVKARADAISEGTTLGRSRGLTRAQLESGLADENASLRRGTVGPSGVYQVAYTRVLICSYTAALSVLGQREASAAQQQQQQQQQQAQRQAMAAPPERPATPSQRKVSEVPPGATQKRGEASDPAEERKPGEKKPAQIANQCVGLIKDPQAYGGFVNHCDFPVYIAWCAYRPQKGAWSEAFDCDQDKGGLGGAAAHGRDAEHTHNAEKIFWFACRQSATPKVKYTSGTGFYGYCQ